MNKCKDCKREININSIRCKSCAKKGELNYNFKGGKKSREKFCLNCDKLLNETAYYRKDKRCKSCSKKKKLNSFFGKYHTEETIKKMSSKAKSNPNHISKHQNGRNNPIYRKIGSIRINKDNTKFIKISNNKWIAEYRYLVGEYIGRKLKKNEIIHHIDGNRTNNKLKNLYIFINKGYHAYFEVLVKQKIVNRFILKSNLNSFRV